MQQQLLHAFQYICTCKPAAIQHVIVMLVRTAKTTLHLCMVLMQFCCSVRAESSRGCPGGYPRNCLSTLHTHTSRQAAAERKQGQSRCRCEGGS